MNYTVFRSKLKQEQGQLAVAVWISTTEAKSHPNKSFSFTRIAGSWGQLQKLLKGSILRPCLCCLQDVLPFVLNALRRCLTFTNGFRRRTGQWRHVMEESEATVTYGRQDRCCVSTMQGGTGTVGTTRVEDCHLPSVIWGKASHRLNKATSAQLTWILWFKIGDHMTFAIHVLRNDTTIATKIFMANKYCITSDYIRCNTHGTLNNAKSFDITKSASTKTSQPVLCSPNRSSLARANSTLDAPIRQLSAAESDDAKTPIAMNGDHKLSLRRKL